MAQCSIEIFDQQTIHPSMKEEKKKRNKVYGKLTYVRQSGRNTGWRRETVKFEIIRKKRRKLTKLYLILKMFSTRVEIFIRHHFLETTSVKCCPLRVQKEHDRGAESHSQLQIFPFLCATLYYQGKNSELEN
jgi:hypothetical protein